MTGRRVVEEVATDEVAPGGGGEMDANYEAFLKRRLPAVLEEVLAVVAADPAHRRLVGTF